MSNFLKTLEDELVSYNRDALHKKSEDTEGNPLGFYSPATEIITKGRKKAGEPFDLLETEKLLNSLFVKASKDSLLFGFSDPKLPKVLSNLLTDNISGLQSEDHNKVVNEKIKPFLSNYFIEKLL